MTLYPIDWTAVVDEAIKRRKREGLTQAELAAISGVSTPTVRALEQGEANMHFGSIASILEALGMLTRPLSEGEFPGFLHAARRRWAELTSALPRGNNATHPLGHIEYCYALGDIANQPGLSELQRALSQIPKTSGWPPFWTPTREGLKPYVRDGLVECWLGEPDTLRVFTDPAQCDFWQVSPDVYAFLQRGYDEDGHANLDPGAIFDVTLPIWRTSEVLFHASNLARRLELEPETKIKFQARYTGLEGRQLANWARPRIHYTLDERLRAKSNTAELSFTVAIADVAYALADRLIEGLKPLYERFDGYTLSSDLVRNQVEEFRKSALTFSAAG